jgi:hypothetical protein
VLGLKAYYGLGFSLCLFIGYPIDLLPLVWNLKIAFGNLAAFILFTWLLKLTQISKENIDA